MTTIHLYGTAILDRITAIGGDLANFRNPTIGLMRILMLFAGFCVGLSTLEHVPILNLVVVLVATAVLTSDLVGGGLMIWASTICGVAWSCVNFIVAQGLYLTPFPNLAQYTAWVIGGAMACLVIWGYVQSRRGFPL